METLRIGRPPAAPVPPPIPARQHLTEVGWRLLGGVLVGLGLGVGLTVWVTVAELLS